MGLQEQINALNSWANESRLLLYDLEDDIDDRVLSAYDKTQHGGIGWIVDSLRSVLYELIEANQWFVYGFTTSFDYVYWGNLHQGLFDKEVDITWKTICEAWIKDDFAGRAPTIACIDRMRQILWNEPYKVTWAARPEEQDLLWA